MKPYTIGDLRRYVANISRADEDKVLTVVDANTAETVPVMWIAYGRDWTGAGSDVGIAIGVETPEQD